MLHFKNHNSFSKLILVEAIDDKEGDIMIIVVPREIEDTRVWMIAKLLNNEAPL